MKFYTDAACNNFLPIKEREMRIVVTAEDGIVLLEKTKHGGSSNVGELWAVCEAIKLAKDCGIENLEVYTDSQNSCKWIKNGRCSPKINDPEAVCYLLVAIEKFREDVKTKILWIPREQNLAGIYIESNGLDFV